MSKKKVMLVLDDETGILGIFEELMGSEFEIHCCKSVSEAKNIPEKTDPIAKINKGTVITYGDSCMWSNIFLSDLLSP